MTTCYGSRRRIAAPATAAAATVLAALMAAPAAHAAPTVPAAQARTHVVSPGQSIQRAVDAARPGDTIVIRPGTYQESVLVTVPRLTIRGAGAQRVTLVPPAAQPATAQQTTAKPAVAQSATAQSATAQSAAAQSATAKAETAKAAAAQPVTAKAPCFAAGVGICVAGTQGDRLTGVRITGLTVRGFATYGIAATETDGLMVTGVAAENNKQYGIGAQKSVRTTFARDLATGNGVAGIFLANTTTEEGGALDLQGARVVGNVMSGNTTGSVLRRVRDVTVQDNTMTGNCAGMYVVGDEGVPKAGHLTVRSNVVSSNTKYCAATSRLPFVQGAGIVLTGVEDTMVEQNTVTGNAGTSVMSGGIVLFHSFVGVPNTSNTIRDNMLSGNAPADLADRDTGTGNTFTGNACTVSQPAGRC